MMKNNKGNASKGLKLLGSWSFGAVCMLAVLLSAGLIMEIRQETELLGSSCLWLTALATCTYTILWMSFGWVKVVEGDYLYAEYGGAENRLQRLVFRDRAAWQFDRPLDLVFDLETRPGYASFVSVWENFHGRNRLMYRLVDLRTGKQVRLRDAEDETGDQS